MIIPTQSRTTQAHTPATAPHIARTTANAIPAQLSTPFTANHTPTARSAQPIPAPSTHAPIQAINTGAVHPIAAQSTPTFPAEPQA